MVLPLFSGRFASSIAAHTAAPEEMPTSTPSFRPISRAGGEGVLVLYGNDLIVDLRVQHVGDKAGADALDLVAAGHALAQNRGGGRLHGDDLHTRGSGSSDTRRRR